jgi:competence protein ComEC
MGSVLFYTIGIAFAFGIFSRSFFDIGYSEILLLFFLSLSTALLWRLRARRPASPLFLVSVALLCFALGVLRLETEERSISLIAPHVGEEVLFEGVITREPDERAATVHLYVTLDPQDERVLVTTDKYQQFQYGDRVAIAGTLAEPESFETELGRTFNYPGYLRARNVRYVVSFAEVEIIARGGGNQLLGYLFLGKGIFMESLERAVTEPAAGLGEGLLLGVKRALGEDLEEAFRRAGIIHIVVLSGYNVMIVAEAIMRLLSFFFLPRTRMLIGVAGIVTFALLVGLSATVVRASIMAILVLIARATGRIYAIVRALMLAGAIMLIINPYLLAFDPGFQLSFLATLGLIFLAPLFERRFGLFPTTLQIREFVTATIATQIFVLPLLLYLIGEFSVVAVIVNVLVLPMVPVAMFLTFVTGVAGTFIAPLATVLGFAAYLSLEYIIALAEFFAALPLATFRVPAFPFSVVVLAYAGITYLIYLAVTQSKEPEMEMDDTVDDLADWTIVEEKDNGTVVTRDTLPFR